MLDEQQKREMVFGFFKTNFPFVLCPANFTRSSELPNLDWVKVKYTERDGHNFPDKKGVYIFMVSVSHANLPENSYVMYVGKAGELNTDNTIAKRFLDYVYPSKYKSRNRIKKMIQFFSDHLYYYYAETPDGQSPGEIEQMLADIFVPPCCQKDFSAEGRSLVRGTRL
ncbi:hypothetical protein AB4356_09530 [Vibrio lentus]